MLITGLNVIGRGNQSIQPSQFTCINQQTLLPEASRGLTNDIQWQAFHDLEERFDRFFPLSPEFSFEHLFVKTVLCGTSYICCIFSSAIQTRFYNGSKHYEGGGTPKKSQKYRVS